MTDLLSGKIRIISKTIRERIIAEMKGLFEAFDFQHLTSPAIYRGRQIFDPDTEGPPLITILPRRDAAEKTPYNKHSISMGLDIIALERIGSANPSVLGEKIHGELIECAFQLSDDWANGITYRSGGIDMYPDELGQQILHVGITVVVAYETRTGNPDKNE